MTKSNNREKFIELRREYPSFVYEDYTFSLSERGLVISFHFILSDRIHFHPGYYIPRKSWFVPDDRILPYLPNTIFNLGMIELISYWKVACSPNVVIKPHRLYPEQLAWWKKVYFNGLGEFFYLNSISTSLSEFMSLEPTGDKVLPFQTVPVSRGTIVPVGGGKDSAVTLELLSSMSAIIPLILNPREANLEILRKRNYRDDDYIEIRRTLDPALLALNDQGFLNGHTPFSALLAFVTILAAILSGRDHIALSNESSASETTIEGTSINHQYSKSVGFESAFREYVRDFITSDVRYFSFLRPLNELQIASLFKQIPQFHDLFRSCNAGSRTNTWCGKCAKCLFTYIILSPFLSVEKMIRIFGRNLLDDPGLRMLFDQLTGIAGDKPFDCVGTTLEVNLALCETIRQSHTNGLPFLMRYYSSQPLFQRYRTLSFRRALADTDPHHYLPPEYLTLLTAALNA